MKNQPLAQLVAAQEIGRTMVWTMRWTNDVNPTMIVGIKPEGDSFLPLSAHCGEGSELRTLWQRQGEHNRPELVDIDGEVMVAVMSRDRSEILALVFLADVIAGERRHEAQRLAQKKKAAAFLRVERFKLDREELKLYEREQSGEEELVTVPVARTDKPKRPAVAPANPVISADVAAAVVTTSADPTEPIRRELLSRAVETVYKKDDGAPMTGIRITAQDKQRLGLLPDGTECYDAKDGFGHHFKVVGGKQRDRIAITTLPPGTVIEGASETAPTQLH